MFGINGDQVASFVRSVVIGVGVYVAAKFGLDVHSDNSFLIEVSGFVGAAAAALWGIYFHAGPTKDKLEKAVIGDLPAPEAVKVEVKAAKAQGVITGA